MQDKELIELSAKSMGIGGVWVKDPVSGINNFIVDGRPWNSLQSAEIAFSLSVFHDMNTFHAANGASAILAEDEEETEFRVDHGADKAGAMMRAITLAAAKAAAL